MKTSPSQISHQPSPKPTKRAPSRKWSLSYATGYFHLGMLDKADAELKRLGRIAQDEPDVASLRGRIFLAREDWEAVVELCDSCRSRFPWIADFYIQQALALAKLERLEEARSTWLAAPREIRATAFYHYNLARCELRLGHLSLARQHLQSAMTLSPSLRDMIHQDKWLAPFAVEAGGN